MDKCIIASDSFKGSLSSIDICHIFEEEYKKIFPLGQLIKIPIADGGEGSVFCFSQFLKGKIEALKKSAGEKEKIKTDCESLKIRIENALKNLNRIEESIQKNKKIPKIIFFIVIAFISSALALYFKNPLFLTIIIPAIPFMFIKENKDSKIIKDILESLPELDIKETDIFIFKDLLKA